MDIEHIVSWAEARRSGLSCTQGHVFVNDMLNIAVALPRNNRQKSDKDIGEWTPQHNKCWFANRVQKVKKKYGLSYDRKELATLSNILENCSEAKKTDWAC